MSNVDVPPPRDGGENLGPLDRATLKNAILAGVAAGLIGAVALLLFDVEPTIEFFATMGAVVIILSYIVGISPQSAAETESDPTYG